MIIVGTTLLQAIVAGGLGTLGWWVVNKFGGPGWLALWVALTVALFVMIASPTIRVG